MRCYEVQQQEHEDLYQNDGLLVKYVTTQLSIQKMIMEKFRATHTTQFLKGTFQVVCVFDSYSGILVKMLLNCEHLLMRLFFCRKPTLEEYDLGISFPFFSTHLRNKYPNRDLHVLNVETGRLNVLMHQFWKCKHHHHHE